MGCVDNRDGGGVGFAITARKGMLTRSRLACAPWLARSLLRIRYGFPQRPLYDLISVSLGAFKMGYGHKPHLIFLFLSFLR